MKKNKFLRMAVALLVVASVCACLFAGNTTLAKYTAAASGEAAVDVAKWSIMVKEVGAADLVLVHEASCSQEDEVLASECTITAGCYGTCGDASCDGVAYKAAVPCDCDPAVTPPTTWTEIAELTPVTLNIKLIDTILEDDGASVETDVKEGFIAPGTSGGVNGLEVYNASDVTADIFVELDFTAFDADVLARLTFTPALTTGKVLLSKTNVAPGAAAIFDIGDFEWLWPFDDGSAADSLGIIAAAADYPALGTEGYDLDNPIGIAAREGTLGDTDITFTVYAIQVN